MRGEHAEAAHNRADLEGSSPHARGAPHERSQENAARGIIPACAGSTWCLLTLGD